MNTNYIIGHTLTYLLHFFVLFGIWQLCKHFVQEKFEHKTAPVRTDEIGTMYVVTVLGCIVGALLFSYAFIYHEANVDLELGETKFNWNTFLTYLLTSLTPAIISTRYYIKSNQERLKWEKFSEHLTKVHEEAYKEWKAKEAER